MRTRLIHSMRSFAKMIIQHGILPIAYEIAKLRHPGVKTLYVFADAHHTELPFSLSVMYNHLVSSGVEPVCHFHDYTHEGSFQSLIHSIAFMDLLAQAKYVFICDTFLPASSGRKDKRTKIVQLCHFSGPFKKIGYDTPDDVPTFYKGNVFGNYDLVTASSECYVPMLTSAMRQKEGVVQALGVSRSDIFFDPDWNGRCVESFYNLYPQAKGKKILLWCPTFRGKAAKPDSLSNESFVTLQEKLGDDWYVLIKHHPHDDAVATNPRHRSNCTLPSEQLLPIVDILVTDYSTTFLDYLAYEKPFVLFAPDLEEYESTRGFFVDYRDITKNLVTDPTQLEKTIEQAYQRWLDGDLTDIHKCKEWFTKMCDGNSTERILDYLYRMETE